VTAPTDLGAWAHHATSRVEDLTFMADHGETTTGAAQRLGLSSDALERWCHRHQLAGLLARLVANAHQPGRLPTGHVANRLVN
jgi:hypothetical protein